VIPSSNSQFFDSDTAVEEGTDREGTGKGGGRDKAGGKERRRRRRRSRENRRRRRRIRRRSWRMRGRSLRKISR
jgi:hypothetical protein